MAWTTAAATPPEAGADNFTFELLTPAYVDAAVELCNQCVGQNLYPRRQLLAAINHAGHYFYLVLTPERQPVAYIYFYLTNLDTIAAQCQLPRHILANAATSERPLAVSFQSIGVAGAYRSLHLAQRLVSFALEQAQSHSPAQVAYALLWKANGVAPMEKNVRALGFSHLADIERPWYNHPSLICPICRGRCECSAALYYKVI